MILPLRSSLLVWAVLAVVGVATTAHAAEEPPVVKALLDGAALNATVRPTYQSVDMAADGSITLKGLSMSLEGEGDAATAMALAVESLTLADVKEIDAGLFEIGAATWSGMTLKLADSPLAAIPVITGRSVYVQQPSETPTVLEKMRASSMLGKEFVMPEAVVLVGGHSLILERARWTWEGDPATGAGTSEFELDRVALPAALMQDESGDNPLAAVGYDQLEFAISGKGVTTYSDEAFGFDFETRLKGTDIGTLVVNVAADGIPLALFGTVDAAEPDAEKLLPMAQAITLKRAKIRFEDSSLTGRIIAMMAQAQGMGEDTFIAVTTEGMKIALAAFSDRTLADTATAALTAFLSDPKTITVSLNPPQPVRVDQIMAVAQDPTAIIKMLAVSVSAND